VSGEPPPEVAQLVADRSAAREERDWATADALRDRIRELGWEVMDETSGTQLRPALPESPAPVGYARPEDLASLLDAPAELRATVVVVAEDHPGDLSRLLSGLAATTPSVSWELVMVANAPSFDVAELLDPIRLEVEPTVVPTSERLGYADAVNLGLRRSRGELSILLDSSVEPVGDLVGPLAAAFEDPSVGLAGPFGVTSDDLRQFNEAPPGEVDAVEGYCLGVRREVLRDVGLFDRHFRFYRNADLDFSFRARAAGWRAVRCEGLPLRLHEHRGYVSLPEAERDRLSKRNFYRFLKHWGDRRDLVLHPAPRHAHRRSGNVA
jgi:GT2 family glycosyltransferase